VSFDVQENENGVTFRIKVLPRASKNEIKGLHNNALRVRLTSPPVDGAANKECINFLAKKLKVPKNKVSIISGEAAREKIISGRGIKKKDVLALMD